MQPSVATVINCWSNMSLVGLGLGGVAIPQLMLLSFGQNRLSTPMTPAFRPWTWLCRCVQTCRSWKNSWPSLRWIDKGSKSYYYCIWWDGGVRFDRGFSSKGDKRTRVVGTFFRKTWQDLVSEIWGSVENVDSSQGCRLSHQRAVKHFGAN